jgi:hypothetical protein
MTPKVLSPLRSTPGFQMDCLVSRYLSGGGSSLAKIRPQRYKGAEGLRASASCVLSR